jgi:hypothetical protein
MLDPLFRADAIERMAENIAVGLGDFSLRRRIGFRPA